MADQQDTNVIIQKFSNYLKEKGKRKTPERFKILEKVLGFKKQFTIDELSRVMSDGNFMVSKSTLYYTMDVLVEADILRKIKTGVGAIAYERVEQVGYIHLKCEHCGKIKLVKDTNFMAYMNARKFAAFTTYYYTFTVFGICNDCARKLKRSCPNNKSQNKKVK